MKPFSGWQPNLSTGFLLRNDLRIEAAFTDNDLGILIGLSRITENEIFFNNYLVQHQKSESNYLILYLFDSE